MLILRLWHYRFLEMDFFFFFQSTTFPDLLLMLACKHGFSSFKQRDYMETSHWMQGIIQSKQFYSLIMEDPVFTEVFNVGFLMTAFQVSPQYV